MKKLILAAVAVVMLVAVLRIHSQAEQSPKADQSGRFQVVFNPNTLAADQTYLVDSASGSVWWFKTDGGKKTAVLVEKTK